MMECRKVRKYLYAFADGQLDVKDSCELLDHLKMCPSCTQVVDEHQAIRKALGRVVNSITIPAALDARMRRRFGTGRPARQPINWRRVIPAGIVAAACFMVAANTVYDFVAGSDSSRQWTRTPGGRATIAEAVALCHNTCSSKGEAHHKPEWSRDPELLANEIATYMRNTCNCTLKPYAPNLLAGGFRVASANVCKILPGAAPGGHIIYQSIERDNLSMSIMSMPNFPWVQQCGDEAPGDAEFLEESVDQFGGDPLNIVAYRSGDDAYIFCSKADHEDMASMIEEVRTLAGVTDIRDVFAVLWSRQ